jgi:hypothetical protein
MRPVHAAQTFAGSVQQAELCWYDTVHWSSWVDGLDRVLRTDDPWPMVGGRVTWESGPAGRGRVTETVIAYTAGVGQTVEVTDDTVTGCQIVAFSTVPQGVQVTLRLEYRLKRRSPITPVVDALFIRREMSLSLGRTLARFGVRLRAEA